MVTTASPDYAHRVARMSLHGISTDAWQRDGVEGSWFYEVEAPGYKYNMPDLAAALGLAQLRRCDALWSRRATIAARYDAAFADLPEIATISEAGLPGYRSVTWYAMVGPPLMPSALAEKINRDVVEILGRQDIIERVRAIQMEPVTSTRADAAKFFAEETELWGKVIKAANIPLQ